MAVFERALPVEGWITGRPATPSRGAQLFRAIAESDLFREALGPLRQITLSQPNAIAVFDGVQSLTFAQLWRTAQKLASDIEISTKPDALVLAVANNDVYFPAMAVGCSLSGRPVLIQDAGAASERQAAIFSAVAGEVSLVVVPADNAPPLPYAPSAIRRVSVELDPRGEDSVPARSVPRDRQDGLVFTSGSTGQPKAVVLTSCCAPKYITDAVTRTRLSPRDTVLSVGSPNNVGLAAALTCLVAGARLRLFDIKQSGLVEMFRVMREEEATMLGLVPSFLRNVAQLPGAREAFTHMRALELFGEPMTWSDVDLIRSILPASCEIIYNMGSTEAGVISSWIVSDEKRHGERVPPGYLAPGRTVILVDENGQAARPGEPGELVVCDDYVSLGDWVDGRIDASRFPTDPRTGKRAYWSGDVVRIGPDGMFEFLGRRDRMVKVHGLRADLGEIEAILKGAPSVADAVVVAQEREADHTTLVAFVVPQPGAILDRGALRRRVATSSAPHMAPTAIHQLETLPTLANGKPDLVQLKQLAAAAS